MEVHWKIRSSRGFTKNQYVEGNYLKKGEAWIVCRFKGEGLGEKEGGGFFLFQLIICWPGITIVRITP